MSVQALNWAYKQNVGNPQAKFLLTVLANYAGAEGYCWPKQETLKKDTELSLRTIQRGLDHLENEGFLRRYRKRQPSGKLTGYYYSLQLPGVSVSPGDQVTQSHVKPGDTESPLIEPPASFEPPAFTDPSVPSGSERLGPPGIVENFRKEYTAAELRGIEGDMAGLLRKHWYPPGRHPKDHTMGQEISIWRQLIKHFDPQELIGAIEVAPEVLQFGRNGGTLKLFRDREKGWPMINRCIGEWQKQQEAKASKGPQSVARILEQMTKGAA